MPEKSKKLDPLELSKQLEAKLGAEMDLELSTVKEPEAEGQPEKPAVLPVEETEPAERRGKMLTQEEIDALLRGISNTPSRTLKDEEVDDLIKSIGSTGSNIEKAEPEVLSGEESEIKKGSREEADKKAEADDWFTTPWPKTKRRETAEEDKTAKDLGAEEVSSLDKKSLSQSAKEAMREMAEGAAGPFVLTAGILSDGFVKGVRRVSEGLDKTVRTAGSSERPSIELTEEEKEYEKKKEEIETALAKVREEYVAAWQATTKAEKETGKLTVIRERIKNFFNKKDDKISEEFFVRPPERKEKTVGGAQAEAQEAKEKFAKAQESYKAAIRAYRDEKVNKLNEKSDELMKKWLEGQGDGIVELEGPAKEILLATTLREAAKIEDLKAQKQIEQMGKARRFINEKAEEFAEWYKALPWQAKLATSAGLMGMAIGGAAIGSTAILFATFLGQVGFRTLGGAMTTAGVEGLVKKWQEKSGEKKLDKEFGGQFLEALKNDNEALDNKLFELVKGQRSAKTKRMAVAGLAGGIVGTGILASAIKEAFGWSGSGASAPKSGETMAFRAQPDNIAGKSNIEIKTGAEVPVVKPESPSLSEGPEEVKISETPAVETAEAGGTKISEPAAVEAGGTGKAAQEIINLEIGKRGPEGALIDNFKANPELAKSFGWDGQADIGKWAGTKAHQLWLASVESELAKPGMADKLTEQGFTPDAEGYAKAMHKIGEGFVELDKQGHISLSDNTSFLKMGEPALEALGGAEESLSSNETPSAKAPTAPEPSVQAKVAPGNALDQMLSGENNAAVALNEDEVLFNKISKVVAQEMNPAVLKDKTFKAAAKITLGKLLEEVPPEVYKDKYALSDYWHRFSELGVKTPKLPGTGFLGDLSYDDWRKYAQMAKFLRENPVLKSVSGLKNMTMEEFLHLYGGDLEKK